jgi:hypothetical protein
MVLLVPWVGDVGVVDTVEQGRPSHNKLKTDNTINTRPLSVVLLVPVVGDVGVDDTVEQGRPSYNKLKQMIQLTQGLSLWYFWFLWWEMLE